MANVISEYLCLENYAQVIEKYNPQVIPYVLVPPFDERKFPSSKIIPREFIIFYRLLFLTRAPPISPCSVFFSGTSNVRTIKRLRKKKKKLEFNKGNRTKKFRFYDVLPQDEQY